MFKYILRIKKLNKYFGKAHVLIDVNLFLKKGSILGIVGENGAGKTTLMNILGGVFKSSSGEIFLDDTLYSPNNPMDAENSGIAFIHQEFDLFNNLTIAENIFLDNKSAGVNGFFSYKTIDLEANKAMYALGVDVDVSKKIEDIPVGIRQMVEIAKSIRKDVRIIIFDEPTTSLSEAEKEKLFKIIRDLSRREISMLYISHNIEEVINISDEIAVLRDGKIIGQRPVSMINKNEIVTMMIGRKISNYFPYIKKSQGKEVLAVKNLNRVGILKNISFSIHSCEIVGLFGLMGAGRTELVKALYGIDPLDSGLVLFNGKRVKKLNIIEWIKNGMAFITENKREEGLLLTKSVGENIILVQLRDMQKKLGALDFRKAKRESSLMIKQLNIKTRNSWREPVMLLSGGNQQKVVIGKWLLSKPNMLILDEPTKGVDVGTKYEIYNYINNLAKNGAAILFISSEMEELIGICDRISIMCKGRITGELPRKEFSQEEIMRLAVEANQYD